MAFVIEQFQFLDESAIYLYSRENDEFTMVGLNVSDNAVYSYFGYYGEWINALVENEKKLVDLEMSIRSRANSIEDAEKVFQNFNIIFTNLLRDKILQGSLLNTEEKLPKEINHVKNFFGKMMAFSMATDAFAHDFTVTTAGGGNVSNTSCLHGDIHIAVSSTNFSGGPSAPSWWSTFYVGGNGSC